MNRELEMRLVEEFPSFFREYGGHARWTCMSRGCAHGDGWFTVLWELCEKIQQECENDPNAQENFRFAQIKEKLGLLRVYQAGGNPGIIQLLQWAEQESARFCEDCGVQEGVSTEPIRSLIKTLCPRCRAERESMLKSVDGEGKP